MTICLGCVSNLDLIMLYISMLRVLQITFCLVEAKSKLKNPAMAVSKEGNDFFFNFLTVCPIDHQ